MRPVLVVLASVSACADLPAARPGACGNGAIDPGEDCDFFDGVGTPAGTTCGAPEDRAGACHWICRAHTDCPANWGCGVDGVCRHPNGTFVEDQILTTAYERLVVGDVDGDGRADLSGAAGSGLVEILYGETDLGFSAADRLPTSGGPMSFASGHLDGDARLDVLTTVDGGLLVALGEADRSVATLVFPTATHDASPPRALLALDEGGEGRVVVLAEAGASTTTVTFDGVAAPGATLPFPLGALAGRPVTADLDGDGDDDLVLTSTESDRLFVLESDVTASPVFDVVEVPIAAGTPAVPFGAEAATNRFLHLADVDGDGHDDVLVTLDLGAGAAIGVARGLGGGAFAPCAADARFEDLITPPQACGDDGAVPPGGDNLQLLAAADLDGDDRADYVVSDGIYLAQDDASGQRLCRVLRSTSPWMEAVVADLNRDAAPDVAAAPALPVLDLLLGTGGGAFARRIVDAGAGAAMLRTGDFDGDLVPDLAFVEANDHFSIAFGVLQGTPERVVMGAIGPVKAFEPMRAADAAGDVDAVTDLLLQWSEEVEQSDAVAFVTGTTSRRMISPYAVGARPVGAALGNFDEDDQPDIVVLTEPLIPTGQGPTVQLIHRVGEEAAALTSGGAADLTTCPALELLRASQELAVADVMGDRRDELVFLPLSGGAPATAVVSLEATADAVQASCATLPGGGGRQLLEDVDGDGHADLVDFGLLSDDLHLEVRWNEGGAGFSAAQAVDLSSVEGTFFWAAGTVQADLDPARELVLAIDGELYLADVAERTVSAPVSAGPGFEGSLIEAADVNGDGLEDLIVTGLGIGTAIFLAVPQGGGVAP